MKRPSFQFYPGDWMHDAALRMVSVGARGLWIDMLCIMHQGSDYGHLKVNGKVILPANLARMCGATLTEVEGWLSELGEAGVFSSADDGCIFSRRMIRDEEIRKARAAGGCKGGNPKLKRKDGAENQEPKDNLPPNLRPTPSSSSSSSSSSSKDKNITTADAVVCAEQSCSPPPEVNPPKKSAPAKPAEPAVLELLTTRADVVVPVTQTQIDQWADAYPAVDVMQALRRIQSWLSCNPKKRKTPAGMFRFVDSWLAREQDKPRVDPGGPPPGQPLGPQPGRQFLNSREKNAQRNAEIFDLERARQFGEPLCN